MITYTTGPYEFYRWKVAAVLAELWRQQGPVELVVPPNQKRFVIPDDRYERLEMELGRPSDGDLAFNDVAIERGAEDSMLLIIEGEGIPTKTRTIRPN